MEVVRLGQGVDRTGRIAPEALERTLDAARRYNDICTELGVEAIRFVATSASRDAENRADFVDGVHDALGVEPEVVEGTEEAELSFRGATGVLAGSAPRTVPRGRPGRRLDRAGARHGHRRGRVLDGRRVRPADRAAPAHRPADRRRDRPVPRATSPQRSTRRPTHVPLGKAVTLVGLAGTVTTVTAHALGLATYDPHAIDGSVLPVETVLAACDDLLARNHEQRAALGFMHPGRVDVIGAGALVWHEVVSRVRDDVARAGGELTSVVTSEHDILDGIAWSVAPR